MPADRISISYMYVGFESGNIITQNDVPTIGENQKFTTNIGRCQNKRQTKEHLNEILKSQMMDDTDRQYQGCGKSYLTMSQGCNKRVSFLLLIS